jgi:hypothetical protein
MLIQIIQTRGRFNVGGLPVLNTPLAAVARVSVASGATAAVGGAKRIVKSGPAPCSRGSHSASDALRPAAVTAGLVSSWITTCSGAN